MIKHALTIGLASASVAVLMSATVAAADTATTTPQSVGSTLEMHIGNDGTVLVRGAKITAINGSTISATQTWGSYNVNWIIQTNGSTEFIRRFGGDSSLSELAVGDFVSFNGPLDATQSVGTVMAKVVKDFSIQKVNATFSGTVASIDSASQSFVLNTKERGAVTVLTSGATAFKLGDASSSYAALQVGQQITKASGVWNNLTNQLSASIVNIYVNKQLLNKRIFEGTLGTLAGTAAPTTATFSIGPTTFTVNIAANTTILSNAYNPITLSQLTSGDHVRIYGAVEMNATSTLDAYILRDTSIKK